MIVIDFYTKPNCCLCSKALTLLERLQKEFLFSVRELDVTENGELEKRYGVLVPVAEIERREVFRYEANEDALRSVLGKLQKDAEEAGI